jgi:glutathione S-transferase
MKLHYSPASTTSLSIVLFCAESRIPFEPSLVNLMTGEQKSPAYLKLSPWGLVPTLDDDGFVLTESSAILKYIAEKHESPAYPRDLRARARVNERMDWINTELYRELGYHFVYPQILPHHARTPDGAQHATVQWGRERARRALSILDEHAFAHGPYLCGDRISIADYFAAQIVHVGSLVGAHYEPYPKLQHWLEIMKALPSWSAVNQVFDGFAASLAGRSHVTLIDARG